MTTMNNQLALKLYTEDGGDEFYPTPNDVIDRMLEGIYVSYGGSIRCRDGCIKTILEPEAGNGKILDALKEREKNHGDKAAEYDAIEFDPNLQHILRGKGYRVVHDDFLTYETYKKYNLIIMNPPFSDGEKHLLKALEMQKEGGKIRCILNAETIRNRYTKTRQDLYRKLMEADAKIEFIENAFLLAERPTDVEIALIQVDIPEKLPESDILENLKQELPDMEEFQRRDDLVEADFMTAIIARYKYEIKAGVKLINEAAAMSPLIMDSFDQNGYPKPIIELKIEGQDDNRTEMINQYIRKVRKKYWKFLFNSKQFGKTMTTSLLHEYMGKLEELGDYEFSIHNVYQIRIDLNKAWGKSIRETIVGLFDELSHQYSWINESSANIHYYNGWKTNKAWKINKKVIMPLNGYYSLGNETRYRPDYHASEKLSDMEKALNYLDGKGCEDIYVRQILDQSEKEGQTKNISLKYFTVTFYKKGTCHIVFTNDKLLQKLNLYGCQKKGWLPPVYGKANYSDLDNEAKAVIDEYEGETEYEKVVADKKYYLEDPAQVLMLAAG